MEINELSDEEMEQVINRGSEHPGYKLRCPNCNGESIPTRNCYWVCPCCRIAFTAADVASVYAVEEIPESTMAELEGLSDEVRSILISEREEERHYDFGQVSED